MAEGVLVRHETTQALEAHMDCRHPLDVIFRIQEATVFRFYLDT